MIPLALALLLATAAPPDDLDQVALTIDGDIPGTRAWTLRALAELPRRKVLLREHDGSEAVFEGVPLHELLARAEAPLGDKLRGENVATVVVVTGSDDYRAVFALPELDPAFNDRPVILADRKNGEPMSDPNGPLRLVVADEKKHARCVRMVQSITVRKIPR